MSLQPHETWNVQDSTKIQEFMCCPRRYFFRYVLGWVYEEPNIHLVFGSSVHKAMEVFYKEGNTPNLTAEAIVEAYEAFLTYYRTYFSEDSDEENEPKTPANFLNALPLYVSTYKSIDRDRKSVV